MARGIFVLILVVALFGAQGCAVLWSGETQGDLVVKQAQADAIRAYGRQYTQENLGVAASPFDTSRRIEVQAPAGTRTSVYARDYDYHASSGW